MPQPRNHRTTASARRAAWIACAGLGLGAAGAVVLWAWERLLGLTHGPLFFAVVAATALCGGTAVVAILRWIAADRRDPVPQRAGSATHAPSFDPAVVHPSRPIPLLPELLLVLALLVCLGLAALFFLLPTNDDDPWIPWATSALVFVALVIRPIRMYLRVRRIGRDAQASEHADGAGTIG